MNAMCYVADFLIGMTLGTVSYIICRLAQGSSASSKGRKTTPAWCCPDLDCSTVVVETELGKTVIGPEATVCHTATDLSEYIQRATCQLFSQSSTDDTNFVLSFSSST